jgi:hypothetical protein
MIWLMRRYEDGTFVANVQILDRNGERMDLTSAYQVY